MWSESNRVRFTRYKNVRGFFSGRFEKRHQTLRIFSEIQTNSHIVTVTKHWHVRESGLINCRFKNSAFNSKIYLKIFNSVNQSDAAMDVVIEEYIIKQLWDKFNFITETLQRSLGYSVYTLLLENISWTIKKIISWAWNECFYETIDCARFLNISVNISEITIAKISVYKHWRHVGQNHSCVWLAKELSSRSNPLLTDEFPTRFSAGVDTRISFKLLQWSVIIIF